MIKGILKEHSIKPYEIAFDFDSVIADTMDLFLEIAKQEYNIDWISYCDFTEYNTEESLEKKNIPPGIVSEIFWKIIFWYWKAEANLCPLPGSMRILGKIADEIGSVNVISHRPNERKIEEWLRHNLGYNTDYNIFISKPEEKHIFCKEIGAKYFVDDCANVCRVLRTNGVTPIVYSQPWNELQLGNEERVDGWTGIDYLIDWS